MVGLNSHGMGNVSNSLHSLDNRRGVANCFVRRSTMTAATLEEARERGLPAARARGTNQVFADAAGRLWDVESSATASAFADHTARGYLAHTNHYVAPEMAPFEGSDHEESRTRLAPPRPCSPKGSTTATSPWPWWPTSCAATNRAPGVHLRPPGARRPAGRAGHDRRQPHLRPGRARLYACAGPPCESAYQVFDMD